MNKRNPLFAAGLSIITLGIYALYWFYKTRTELNESGSGNMNPILATVLLFVPLANLYSLWVLSNDIQTATKGSANGILVFVLMLFLFPAGVYVAQDGLNKA